MEVSQGLQGHHVRVDDVLPGFEDQIERAVALERRVGDILVGVHLNLAVRVDHTAGDIVGIDGHVLESRDGGVVDLLRSVDRHVAAGHDVAGVKATHVVVLVAVHLNVATCQNAGVGHVRVCVQAHVSAGTDVGIVDELQGVQRDVLELADHVRLDDRLQPRGECHVAHLTDEHAVDDVGTRGHVDIADGDDLVAVDLAVVSQGLKCDGPVGSLGDERAVNNVTDLGGSSDVAVHADQADVDDAAERIQVVGIQGAEAGICVDAADGRDVDAVDFLQSVHQDGATGMDAAADDVHRVARDQVAEEVARGIRHNTGHRVVRVGVV